MKRKRLLVTTSFLLSSLGLISCSNASSEVPSTSSPSVSADESSTAGDDLSSVLPDDVSSSIPHDVESIEIVASSTSLYEGESLQLSAVVEPGGAPDKSVSWKSEDETVATVDEKGLVTARKEGEVVITASHTNDDGGIVSDSVSLTVLHKEVLIQSLTLSLDPDVQEMEVGDRVALSYSYLPVDPEPDNVEATYSVSDNSKAHLVTEEGVTYLVADAIGQVTVRCESADVGNAEDSRTLTIVPKTILVSSIDLNVEKDTLYPGEQTQVLATVHPTDATDTAVLFESSAPDVASVDKDGLVTAKKAGDVTIACTSADGNAKATLDIHVLEEDIPYVGSLLAKSRELEIEGASSGSLTRDGSVATWNAYSDSSVQIDSAKGKALYYMEGFDVVELLLTEDGKAVSKTVLGTVNDDLTSEEAEALVSTYHDETQSTVSTLALNVLTSESFANKTVDYENATEGTERTFAGKATFAESGVQKENSYALTFDGEGRLLSFSYEEKSGEDVVARIDAELSYSERIESDEDKLVESDYHATDFQIDTSSAWHPDNTLYVGDKVPVEVDVLSPVPHLPMTFTIDENNGISNPSILHVSEENGIYYLEAVKAGTATLTVTGEYGLERSVDITVTEIPPEKIEIRAGSLTELQAGQSQVYYVDVSPYAAKDKSFTATFSEEGMGQYAEISNVGDTSFTLTAKENEEDQVVTVVVASTIDPTISDSITVTIRKKAQTSGLETVKEGLVGATFNYLSMHSITFTSATEGTITTYKNTYSFRWDIEEVDGMSNYHLLFSDVVLTAGTGTGTYTFDGLDSSYFENYKQDRFANYVSKDGQTVQIIIGGSGTTLTRK